MYGSVEAAAAAVAVMVADSLPSLASPVLGVPPVERGVVKWWGGEEGVEGVDVLRVGIEVSCDEGDVSRGVASEIAASTPPA